MSEYGCKVCRVLDEYSMERYEDQLLEQWQADGPQRKGYRQLAEWFNTLMLRREMDRAGLSTLGDEAESKYERLQSDEAFASVVAAWLEETGASWEDVNVNGGAIAHGHPLGATGAMLLTKLAHELERTGQDTALSAMCIGFGQGIATILERV